MVNPVSCAATSPPAPFSPAGGDLWNDPQMSSDEVRYERQGAAAVLTIDRPARRNAVDAATAEALRQGLERFEADEDARALVLTGSGEAFCAGADLKAIDLDVDHPGGPMGFTRLTPSKPSTAGPSGCRG